VAFLLLLAAVAGCADSHTVTSRRTPAAKVTTQVRRLVDHSIGMLTSPVQDASAAPSGSDVVLLGGLNSADVSTSTIRVIHNGVARTRGSLPTALHDAAAVSLSGQTYLLGGGNVAQFDTILRVDPAISKVAIVGHLPAAASDLSAAVLHGTAYIVGGYTGTQWLNTILAWRPGKAPRVVGRLPVPLRYAAVAANGHELIIAGGSTPSGTASRSVLKFDPRTRTLTRLGSLPAGTTHAAAASLQSVTYVIGGRGAAPDTPTSRIVAVDSATRQIRRAGTLNSPRSDLAAVTVGDRIVLAGGRGPRGPVAALDQLIPSGTVRTISRHAARRAKRAAPIANVYAHDGQGMLSTVARRARPLIYVPNSMSNTVDEIDPRTGRIVRRFTTGALPQHVTPSWDLKRLYVLNDLGNSLTPIDPRTGIPGRPIPVDDPYNMYFTPNGRFAIVVAERLQRLDFRDPHTFRLIKSVSVPCRGVDHMDFSADGRYAVASCEFSGALLKLDVIHMRVLKQMYLRVVSMPQDVKLSPDGRVFYVADMARDGVWEIDGNRWLILGFVPTGRGAHGLYASRDARYLYVTNRGEGSISVISFASRHVVKKWVLPGGGSPDMGNVSADGKILWVSGRWNDVVYAISTRNGRLLMRIPVGASPHGLCVWPQPGRYSLGHTGVLR
jgi:DNA-binding beta-propeller fold protein YncE